MRNTGDVGLVGYGRMIKCTVITASLLFASSTLAAESWNILGVSPNMTREESEAAIKKSWPAVKFSEKIDTIVKTSLETVVAPPEIVATSIDADAKGESLTLKLDFSNKVMSIGRGKLYAQADMPTAMQLMVSIGEKYAPGQQIPADFGDRPEKLSRDASGAVTLGVNLNLEYNCRMHGDVYVCDPPALAALIYHEDDNFRPQMMKADFTKFAQILIISPSLTNTGSPGKVSAFALILADQKALLDYETAAAVKKFDAEERQTTADSKKGIPNGTTKF